MSSLIRLVICILPFLLVTVSAAPAAACSAPAPTTSTAALPSPIMADGTANPFHPCGSTAAEVEACPYRCYGKDGSLRDQCYNQQSATAAIDGLQDICVQCVVPDQPEDHSRSCQPLSTYFNTTSTTYPSACGFKNHHLRSCAWECGEAQVPFTVCSATNTTGTYSLCALCKPMCSSPRIVFNLPSLPSNFSISAGDCSAQYGQQQIVACPWRCRHAGRPEEFCSLTDRTDGSFTNCYSCQ